MGIRTHNLRIRSPTYSKEAKYYYKLFKFQHDSVVQW